MNLAVLPLLIVLCSIFLGSALLVRNLLQYQKLTTACLTASMRLQDDVRRDLQDLVNLNPRARSLRRKYKAALVRLAKAVSSGNPALIATAKAHLRLIQSQRHLLDQRQKLLIAQADFTNSRADRSISRAMGNSPRVSTPKFSVEADEPGIAPQYNPASDFSEQQEVVVRWLFRSKEVRCAATVEERDKKFRPAMTYVGDSDE